VICAADAACEAARVLLVTPGRRRQLRWALPGDSVRGVPRVCTAEWLSASFNSLLEGMQDRASEKHVKWLEKCLPCAL